MSIEIEILKFSKWDDMVDQEKLAAHWSEELAGAPAGRILVWAAQTFPGKVALASSLGVEDQLLTHLIAQLTPTLPIFTLDTGRLFPDTYDLLRRTERRYGLRIKLYFPEAAGVERLVNDHGIDAYRESVELRRECCRVRKVEPLRRALAGLEAWVCGLRREQAVTRREMAPVEWDAVHGRYKINPLAEWTEAQVWEFIRQHNVPHAPAARQGFSFDRLRLLHARRGSRRGRARGALVVGESGAQGMWTACHAESRIQNSEFRNRRGMSYGFTRSIGSQERSYS